MRFTLAVVLLLLSAGVLAQPFPSRRVTFVSGVTPGSASDTMARILADKLQAKWGQPVIVENKVGAGGLVGAKYVAQSEPDGHTIMMYASAFTVSTLLSPEVMNPKELQAVAMVATIPTILVAPPEKGYKNVADLVAAAKKTPGGLVCSNAGIGSATHMNLERFRFSAGNQVFSIPTTGGSGAPTEVLSGRAHWYFALLFPAN